MAVVGGNHGDSHNTTVVGIVRSTNLATAAVVVVGNHVDSHNMTGCKDIVIVSCMTGYSNLVAVLQVGWVTVHNHLTDFPAETLGGTHVQTDLYKQKQIYHNINSQTCLNITGH